MRVIDNMVLFWGDEDIFSNFHPASFIFYVGEDIRFPTSEHAFMYMKALFFGDVEIAAKILVAPKPYYAKKLGRQIKNFEEDLWGAISETVMYEVNEAKYTQNTALLEGLMATRGKELVEASKFDKIWGTGFAEDDPQGYNKYNWPPNCNKLGRVLTKLRDDLYQKLYC